MPAYEGKLRQLLAPETMELHSESGAKVQGTAYDNVLVMVLDYCTNRSMPGDKALPEVGQRVRIHVTVEPDEATKDPHDERTV